MSVKFEGYERRIAKIEKALKEYGIESLEAARDLCLSKGVDVDKIVRGVQPIAFENAVWAYTLGAAIALKKNSKNAAEAAENIGIGLQAFWHPGFGRPPTSKSVSATATSPRCCCATKPSASASSPVTNRSRRRKVRSASPRPPTRSARSRSA